MCERWIKFENFLEDMGARPPNTSLDRVDYNGNYNLENCRWADKKTQSANRRVPRARGGYKTYILSLIEFLPCTTIELCVALDMHNETVVREIRNLRREGKISTRRVAKEPSLPRASGNGLTLYCEPVCHFSGKYE